ncbi:MAG TPA: ATP-binding protein [Thermoanaerobaculia bacterium]|nr:ATP-binding protein [Thermoanaerobaculia bacterium]
MAAATDPNERILILAPRGRDAPLSRELLRGEGLDAEICADLSDFCRKIPGAGAGLLTEEVLVPQFDLVARALAEQPPWSDFPLILFHGPEPTPGIRLLDVLELLGNVTLLERPVRKLSLATAVVAALRARRRQYQVRDLLRDLEENVRQRDQFLAMLGHELRNPLGAITAALEVRRRRRGEGHDAETAIVERQSRHLSRLVDDLLDVSRVTSGKITLEKRPVDLVDLADRCVQALALPAGAQKLDLSLVADEGVHVEGDPVRLEQAVMNIVANAVKYTPFGGRVVVEVRRMDERAVLLVRDTGAGISSEMLPKIFNLFAQAPDTLDRAQGGMGIGLTLARSLIERHGGTVTAASDGPGHGSEFRISLPLLGRPLAAPELPCEAPGSKRGAARIVLIEDNDDLRESIRQLLELDGCTVETAGDGRGGLEAIRRLRPEIALVDIGLPGVDGYQIARTVRAELGGAIRMIALTGYGQAEDRDRARDAGFDGHLTKPVSGRALRAALQKSPAAAAQ